MQDEQKTAPEDTPAPDEQELKNEELDSVSGGNNGGSGSGPPEPHH